MAKPAIFDFISPLDYRYYGSIPEIKDYLSESSFIVYLGKFEASLAKCLARRKLCPDSVAAEIEKASRAVSAEEVYEEEERIRHNIRALANTIRKKVSDEAKPYVHLSATSHDAICSADAARFRDFANKSLIKVLLSLESTLIKIAMQEKATLQIGRTHGQHAEPITFGFAVAQYVSRLGKRILLIQKTANDLRGKLAGAVGAYNAPSLIIKDSEAFEEEVLAELGIKPSPISTQVVEAEYMADFVHAVISCFGVLANISDDMRHLQRSEISEIREQFGNDQVGSSTMPHKMNPINFENVKSMWKEFMPRMSTLYLDQISEHQRDLTNSASSRFVPEILAALYLSAARLDKTLSKIEVNSSALKKNFDSGKDMITAEPLYVLLSSKGHPDAHEHARKLSLKSREIKESIYSLAMKDKELEPYMKKLTKEQLEILKSPEKYTGIAEKKTVSICEEWEEKIKDISV